MSKIKKLYFSDKAEVYDWLKDNFPVKTKQLIKKFPEMNVNTLRVYNNEYRKFYVKEGLTPAHIKRLMNIMKNKMTPIARLSNKEMELIEFIGKWVDERHS